MRSLATRAAGFLLSALPSNRHSSLAHLPQSQNSDPNIADVLIVGGGINGVGIARDAAGRGHKVVLVEQHDLASATSSASTKLIHGGLRYLETFELRLVREALIERERLLAIAPHIIRPMQFVLPHVPALRPRWQIRIGLFLYDHLGGRRILPSSRSVRIAGTPLGAALNESIRHGFTYADCWVDDSRLVVLNAVDARERGAKIMTRTRFVAAQRVGDVWQAELRDASGTVSTVRARCLVNAAGPWVEQVLSSIAGANSGGQIRLVKGSHIVVPRLYVGTHAYMLQNPDGRIVFAIPYEDEFTLVGTTDVAVSADTAQPQITAEEIGYLCQTVNGYFRRVLSPADVRWSYAGIRPLSDDDERNASKVTRDYKLELHAERSGAPLLSVFGGKITTYRRLAEAALQRMRPFIGGAKQGWTDRAALPGGDIPRGDFASFLSGVRRRWPFLSEQLAHRLARAYGTRISELLGAAKHLDDLGRDFGGGLTSAELEYLQSHEWAETAEDVLWRRTKVGLHMNQAQRDVLTRLLDAEQGSATAKRGY
jgi:glycerol-3-phosphate dehydrogenase